MPSKSQAGLRTVPALTVPLSRSRMRKGRPTEPRPKLPRPIERSRPSHHLEKTPSVRFPHHSLRRRLLYFPRGSPRSCRRYATEVNIHDHRPVIVKVLRPPLLLSTFYRVILYEFEHLCWCPLHPHVRKNCCSNWTREDSHTQWGCLPRAVANRPDRSALAAPNSRLK